MAALRPAPDMPVTMTSGTRGLSAGPWPRRARALSGVAFIAP
jgi:hypothetical protein